jgi:hypothetical protein
MSVGSPQLVYFYTVVHYVDNFVFKRLTLKIKSITLSSTVVRLISCLICGMRAPRETRIQQQVRCSTQRSLLGKMVIHLMISRCLKISRHPFAIADVVNWEAVVVRR